MRARDFVALNEANLFEVDMSPSNLKRLASRINARVGMEFEMIIPDVSVSDPDDDDVAEDWTPDVRARSFTGIRSFFYGNYNGRREVDALLNKLTEEYQDWLSGQISTKWQGDGEEYLLDWLKENASAKEIGNYIGTEPDLLGDVVADKEDYATAAEQAWEEEGYFYDQAEKAFIEEEMDDPSWDEEEFLLAKNINNMSDILRNRMTADIDITWPHWREPDDNEEILKQLADNFEQAIGREVKYTSSYHGSYKLPNKYYIEPDDSIDADEGEAGLEFVSPPLTIDEMLTDLKKVKKWAKSHKATTNNSTGLHINISTPNYNMDDLDYVKLVLLSGDKYVLQQFGRLTNTYATDALNIIETRAKGDKQKVEAMLDKLHSNVEEIASKVLHSGRTAKYTSINTKDGWVEFRSPGGDWLDENFDKIEDTMLRYVVALDAACDPKKYRDEYLKELYKLVKPKSKTDEMSYFAQYMAGSMTKSEYADKIIETKKNRLKNAGIYVVLPSNAVEGDWKVEYDNPKDSTIPKKTVYISNTGGVTDSGKALDAAMMYIPTVFNKQSIPYITVSRLKAGDLGKNWVVTNRDGDRARMVNAATNADAAQEALRHWPQIFGDDRIGSVVLHEPSGQPVPGTRAADESLRWRVTNQETGAYTYANATDAASAIALVRAAHASYRDADTVYAELSPRAPGGDFHAVSRYRVVNNETGQQISLIANSPERAVAIARVIMPDWEAMTATADRPWPGPRPEVELTPMTRPLTTIGTPPPVPTPTRFAVRDLESSEIRMIDAYSAPEARRLAQVFFGWPLSQTIARPVIDEDWKKTAKGLGMAAAIALGSHGTPTNVNEPKEPKADIVSQQSPKVDPAVVKQVISGLTSTNGVALRRAAQAAGIKGVQLAQFLAQCAHETANFASLKEFGGRLDFKQYDPRFNPQKAKLLGNTHAGDGVRYHGRGFIQLTGRENYRKVGDALDLPLESNPELVERPDVAAKVAVWYWQNRVAPKVNDFSDTKLVTKPINASMHGIDDRQTKFDAIMQILSSNNGHKPR